jgi:hypothetical protein
MRAVSLIRWCRPGLVAAAICCFVAVGRARETTPDIDQEMKASLRKAFIYQAGQAEAAPVKVQPGVILLPRMVVRNRFEAEGLDDAIAHQESIDDRFTLGKGGTLYSGVNGRVAVAVGAWYDADNADKKFPGGAVPGLNVLKFAW